MNSIEEETKIQQTPATTTAEKPEPIILVDMDIDVTAPLIYLPESSVSKKCISADLGRIIVNNTFDKVDEMEKMMNDNYTTNNDGDDFIGTDIIKATLSDVELFM